MVYLVCIILALLVGFVYYPALDAYFTADDFWHLPFLYQAISLGRTELLWQNFSGPWIGKTTFYLFYRPITELTLALDYALYGKNAFGYHLTSILFHYANCVLVYLVSLKYLMLNDKDNFDLRRNQLVSFIVSAIFAVHPAQGEAVSWVLARADLVGSFFSLLAIYFSMHYVQTSKRFFYILMLVFISLALGSKELCAGLPLAIAVIIFAIRRDLKKTLKDVFLPFVLLAIYFANRTLALGFTLGGYVGTHGYRLNESIFERLIGLQVWWKLAHPINTQFIGDFAFYDNCLRQAYVILAILIVLNVLMSESIYKRFLLSLNCIILIMVFILINYQVWNVYESLAGSRIFYLLIFPLALAVSNIVVPASLKENRAKTSSLLFYSVLPVAVLLIGTYSILCNMANQAWQSAGYKIKNIQSKLASQLESMPSSKRLAVINLPPIIDGTVAIYVSDFLSGLTLPPLTEKNYWQRLICLDTDLKTVNIQNLKDLANNTDIELGLWNQKDGDLDLSLGPRLRQAELDKLKYSDALNIGETGRFKCLDWRIYKNKDFYNNKYLGDEIASYKISLPANAQLGRDLILNLKGDFEHSNDSNDSNQSKLLCLSFDDSNAHTNADHPPVIFKLPNLAKSLNVVIPLSQEKSWLAVLPQKDMRIDLPVCYKISDARLVNCDSLKPKLALSHDVEQAPNGYFTPSDSIKNLTFNYSCTHIKGACGALVEISKPNCVFAVYTGTTRDTKPSEHALKSIKLIENQGSFSIPVSEFPQPAYYQVRLAPVNADGRIISAFGDPVSMSLFNPNKN
ncbi:MAG: hypothetical protein KIT34_05705 [Cyanobacteria bacterium TGS_CYA1]|nr:hypothetical protein [Cyanobacteria bacterium TGS_CYA1]